MNTLLYKKRSPLPAIGIYYGAIRFFEFITSGLQLLMIVYNKLGKSLKFFFLTIPFIISLLFQHKAYTQGSDLQKKILVDQLDREYLIHFPPGYSSTCACPVIFAFHGGGGSYENTPALYNLNAVSDKYNFIVVYPNAINKSWCMKGVGSMVKEQEIDDVKFISVLMDTLIKNYHVDSSSFFATGLSRGGIFSLFIVHKLSGRFKAIAPVCASIPLSLVDTYTFYPVSILLINGTDDPLLPFDGGHGEISRSKRNEENHFISTHDLVHKIKILNSCPELAIAHPLPNQEKGDRCTAVKTSYQCSGTRFVFIKINNGGHTWPGGPQYLPPSIVGKVCRDFKAEVEIINFFVAMK